MKNIIKVIVHPYVVMILFCSLLISGKQMGGFYLFYVLLGLPHFALHSVLGVAGILILFISVIVHKMPLSALLNTAGLVCMLLSLFRFFLQPGGSYNQQTFETVMPCSLMVLFAVVALIFAGWNVRTIVSSITQ